MHVDSMDKIKVSVLLLTQNSEKTLRRCLSSLTKFDEVVLIDGGSNDKTIEIAREFINVKVYVNPWPGFIEQRNYSLSKATHKWCFMIDSDEAATSELVEEIKRVISLSDPKKLYKVMRTEFYLGKTIEFGYGRSNWQERLFLKQHISYTGGVHHQHLIDGVHQSRKLEDIDSLELNARVLHDEDYGLRDWILKLPRFSMLRAQEKIDAGRKVGRLAVFSEFILSFLKIYFQNYKHKKIGFVISIQTALFRTLVKLMIYEDNEVGFDRNKSDMLKRLG